MRRILIITLAMSLLLVCSSAVGVVDFVVANQYHSVLIHNSTRYVLFGPCLAQNGFSFLAFDEPQQRITYHTITNAGINKDATAICTADKGYLVASTLFVKREVLAVTLWLQRRELRRTEEPC